MLPTAIEISGFRSFGVNQVRIDSLKKINFFVGQNNSGKSNVLRAITMVSSARGSDPKLTPRSSDFAAGCDQICVYLHFANEILRDVFLTRGANRHDANLRQIRKDKTFAFPFAIDRSGRTVLGAAQIDRFVESWGDAQEAIRQLIRNYLGVSGSTQNQVEQLINHLQLTDYLGKKVVFIPQIRSVHTIKQYVDGVDQFIDAQHPIIFSGDRMIDLLFRLQRPSYDAQADKMKFEKIVKFLRDITQNESITLEVPHDKSSILVNMDGKTLPLHNLGTGIEEILIMAAASLGFEDKLVCIEEPELHIHPILQKKLVQLLGQTDNQFLITTHSSTLIDINAGAIYNVRAVKGRTEITNPVSPSDARLALHDLGYRPSDLLQTNSIVWVEGPSDRIYLSKWLSIADPSLREGIDYSIMFYGGRLLSHLSASEETVGEFIELLKLNRFSSIVIDSDKESERAEISSTKKRLVREIGTSGGLQPAERSKTRFRGTSLKLLRRR